jgi:hypothetical protein
MTTESRVKVAEMQVSLTFKFSASPVTAQKQADKIYRQLQRAGVSADVTLAFESGHASAAGGR